MMKPEQKNLFIALALSLAILLGFQYFYEAPRQEKLQQQVEAEKSLEIDEADIMAVQTDQLQPGAADDRGIIDGLSRQDVIDFQKKTAPRVFVETASVNGSISLKGGRIDDLVLKDYRVAPDPESPNVELLSPSGSIEPYFVESGWVSPDKTLALPDQNTVWQTSSHKLTETQPVTLTYDNGKGLIFKREIAIDENFLFTINQTVVNKTNNVVSVIPYSLISRQNPPPVLGFFILHEGPIGVLNDTLEEVKYKNLDDNSTYQYTSKGGWLGITDKYWLVSMIPDQNDQISARILKNPSKNQYQVDYTGSVKTVAPNSEISNKSHIFAGAKQVELLDAYEKQLAIPMFDKAVDFGWFYFLTKPFFYGLKFIAGYVGNFGIAILIFTVLIKAVLFPLANKSYQSMSKMKKLQPKMEALKKEAGDDKMKLNQGMMELYKTEKVNPASGCLPILVQIPIFFALYKVLFVTIEMRQAPFYGWIKDLSVPDPTTLFNLFGLLPWTPPSFLMIGAWPIMMGITMFLQQKLNPAPADPVQQKVFMFMPIMFTFLLASFPAGLVIYWAWNNFLSIIQQWVIMKKMKAI
jgi:YidC/Oxa1 family membrane protein insertase